MANNIYLQVEFSTGNLYQYSKEALEGFERHTNKNKKVTYRKYWKEGVYGVYRGTSVRKTNFGKELSVHMINRNGRNIFISLPLFDQNKNIAAYAESFIGVLPSLEMNFVYRVFPYAMQKKGTEYKNYGVSVAHADMHERTVRSDHPLERLSYTYEKDGKTVEGDIPAVVWKKDFDDTMKKDCTDRNKYLFDVLMKYAQEKTSGAGNKVTGDEPPKAYTGSFENGTTTETAPEANAEEHPEVEHETEEEATPKASEAPAKKTPPAKAEEEAEQKPSEEEDVELPF